MSAGNIAAVRFNWNSEKSCKKILFKRCDDSSFKVQSSITADGFSEKPEYIIFNAYMKDISDLLFRECCIHKWGDNRKGYSPFPFEWFIGVKLLDGTIFARNGKDYCPKDFQKVLFCFVPFMGSLEDSLREDIQGQQKQLAECGALDGLELFETDDEFISGLYFEKFLL